MTTKTTERSELGTAEYLEEALEDLDRARHNAAEELRSMIDTAIGRSREALDHLRADAEQRAEHLRERAEERASEWQRILEGASEDARRELGIRAVRAQRTPAALKTMSAEIKDRKKELRASH